MPKPSLGKPSVVTMMRNHLAAKAICKQWRKEAWGTAAAAGELFRQKAFRSRQGKPVHAAQHTHLEQHGDHGAHVLVGPAGGTGQVTTPFGTDSRHAPAMHSGTAACSRAAAAHSSLPAIQHLPEEVNPASEKQQQLSGEELPQQAVSRAGNVERKGDGHDEVRDHCEKLPDWKAQLPAWRARGELYLLPAACMLAAPSSLLQQDARFCRSPLGNSQALEAADGVQGRQQHEDAHGQCAPAALVVQHRPLVPFGIVLQRQHLRAAQAREGTLSVSRLMAKHPRPPAAASLNNWSPPGMPPQCRTAARRRRRPSRWPACQSPSTG